MKYITANFSNNLKEKGTRRTLYVWVSGSGSAKKKYGYATSALKGKTSIPGIYVLFIDTNQNLCAKRVFKLLLILNWYNKL